MQKRVIIEEIKSLVGITFGIMLYSFAVAAFCVPNDIVSGGFGGIGTIVYFLTDERIPVGLTYFLLNLVVLIAAYKIMGWHFVRLSIIGVAITSALLIVMQKMITAPLIPNDKFMNTILGGAIGGVGLGITFNSGGNTGGTDIISLIFSKYKNVSTGRVSLYCNILILIATYFVFKDMENVVYGFVIMWVTSYTVDMMLNGHRQSYQFIIMSTKYDEIANEVTRQLKRGVTVVDSKGWFTKTESSVLIIIVSKHDKNKLLKLVKRIDDKAFLSVSRVESVFGKNFDIIK